jgi:SAF domain-containing protein
MLRSPRSPAAITALAARLRLRLARRRSLGRVAAVGCIALGVWAGATTLGSMADARDAWGTTVPIAVADVALAPGDHADATTVSLRDWPAALVPPDALRDVPDAVVRQRVAPGEPLSPADVGPAAGPAGLLPAGWVAVAVPLDEARRPPLAIADRVGVVVGGVRVTGGAVVEASAGLVIVAVPAGDAAQVAATALDDAVSLTLEPHE